MPTTLGSAAASRLESNDRTPRTYAGPAGAESVSIPKEVSPQLRAQRSRSGHTDEMTADQADDVASDTTARHVRTAERRPAQTATTPRPVPAPAQPATAPPPEQAPPEQAPAAQAQPGGVPQASGNGWVVPLCVLI